MSSLKDILLNPEVRPLWGNGDGAELLAAYERVWNRKIIIRQLYETWYEKIASKMRPGSSMEVGAITGKRKRWLKACGRECWTLDILPGKYVDMQADALQMPLAAGSVDNIVMVHFESPLAFLKHATEMLRKGGHILLIEPFVSTWAVSRIALCYRIRYYLHSVVRNNRVCSRIVPWRCG